MFHLFRIAANAFRESLREPVYFLMLLAALLLIGHYPWMTLFVFFEQLKLVVDGAMATTMIFSFFTGILCAGNTVSREMKNGTVLLLLSKPVSRWTFVVGKIAGVTAAALFFCAVCCCASMVAVFVAVDQFRLNTGLYYTILGVLGAGTAFGLLLNYLKGVSFAEYASYATAAGIVILMICCFKMETPPELSLVNLAKVLILLHFGVIVMTAFAVGFATRFDSVPAICCSTVLFFLGLVSHYLFTRPAASPLLNWICAALYAVIPNWQFFWLADAIAAGKTVSLTYLGFAFLYAVACFLLASLWAVALFQSREAASENRN